ncbi:MAG: tail fiber domain-containing protein [Nitrosomonas sp.]|uniref:tail fiber domain-containing protein n=1 Tax=Nitrosomonas sp. TaxID=42353 RepID=UPI00272EF524|nr:tail fiber domain-containing protein [Nitrosomonas sp.]MDP1549056.1 tail fiber domain-containing protein [Nitrosomonas sp.]
MSATALLLLVVFTFTPLQTQASNGFFSSVWCNITGLLGFACKIPAEAEVPEPEVSVATPPPLPKPNDNLIVNSVSEVPAQNTTVIEEHNTYNTNPTTVIYQNSSNEITDSEFLNLFHKLTNLIGKTGQQGSGVSYDLFDKQIDKVFDKSSENINNVQEDISTLSTDIADSFTTDLLTVTGNTAINGNATVDGDLNVIGTISAGVLNVDALSSGGALVAPYFSATSTVATSTFIGAVGIGTTSPNEKLTVIGNTYLNGGLTLTGVFKDSTSATGTNGMILKSTGSATEWMATSTLGIAISDTTGTLAATRGGTGLSSITQSQLLIGGAGNTWTQVATSSLGFGDGTFTGLSDTQNSLTANRLIFANSGGTALTDSANLTFNGTNLGIGLANSSYVLEVNGTASTTQLRIPSTASASVGGLYFDSNRFLHNYGTGNTFTGSFSGNTTLTGTNNIGNGQYALTSLSSGIQNVGLGRQALTSLTTGSSNIGIGFQSLYSATSSAGLIGIGDSTLRNASIGAIENIAIGYFAGNAVTAGSRNVLMGHLTGSELTSGGSNTMIGNRSGINVTTSQENTFLGAFTGQNMTFDGTYGYGGTFVGYNTGNANTSGTFNTFLGHQAGKSNTSGGSNVLVGRAAGNVNTTGGFNTFLGHAAGFYNVSGDSNLFLGNSAGSNLNTALANVSGDYNIYLGTYAGPGTTTQLTNAVAIGNYANATADNVIVLGSASSSWATNVGIGVTAPTASLHASGTVRFESFGAGTLQTDANGNLSVSSDERLKNVMGDFSPGLNAILGLQPIQYKWLKETGYDNETLYSGFSAQNVQSVLPEAVGEDKRGFLTLSDRPIMAAIVNAIKELWNTVTNNQKRIEALENGVANQDMKRIEDLEAEVSKLKEMMQHPVIDNSDKDSKSNITEDVSSTTLDVENKSSEATSTVTASVILKEVESDLLDDAEEDSADLPTSLTPTKSSGEITSDTSSEMDTDLTEETLTEEPELHLEPTT